jgi:hypothetical protein
VLEVTAEACQNGIDDDFDGSADCADHKCRQNPSLTLCDGHGGEHDDAACSDGIDNDGDGFVDCKDFSCSQAALVGVCAPIVEHSALCSNGIDDDQDGHIDCDDFSCAWSHPDCSCS